MNLYLTDKIDLTDIKATVRQGKSLSVFSLSRLGLIIFSSGNDIKKIIGLIQVLAFFKNVCYNINRVKTKIKTNEKFEKTSNI